MKRRSVPLACISVLATWAGPSWADGAWGRLEADMAVQGDVGAGVAEGAFSTTSGLAVRYLQTAGAYTTWMVPVEDKADHRLTVSLGVELRPLFLPRLLKHMQGADARLNLWVDSLALRVGAVTADRGPFARGQGFETGLGFGVPILPCASGPWVSTSGVWRWPHDAMLAHHDHAFVWTVTLGWQASFRSGLVDWDDGRPQ
jgi:hypothetical protein